MRRCLALIMLFFYIYPILFIGMPVSTRLLYSFFAIIFVLYGVACKKSSLAREYLLILSVLFSIFSLSCLSIFINGTSDFEFIKYPISIIAILFSAYALIRIFGMMDVSYDFNSIAKLFVSVVFIQSVIAVLMFIIPSFYDLMTSIQVISIDEVEKMSSLSEMRIIGFGSQYFGAGIINGLALIILAYLIRIGEYDSTILKASILFLLIFAVGIGMARTTFIGFGIAILLLLPFSGLSKLNLTLVKRNIMLLLSVSVLILLAFMSVYVFFPTVISSVTPLFNFALEMFLNYFESGSLTTESTSQLATMYVWPENMYTYFIGDGLYSADNGLYYMDTDVGYLRLLFYFGVLGIILFLSLQYSLLSFSVQKIKGGNLLFFCIFIYLIALNFKGFADLASILALFFTAKIFTDKSQCNHFSRCRIVRN
ncbi:TPA: hypothetical protein P2R06_000970 [Aeromonas veronii]|nr:hypothetical protein [Aeromonas veronii]